MKTPEEKYLHDPIYHAIVDHMVHGIYKNQYTPSELREMAIFAATKYEIEKVRRIFIRPYGNIPEDQDFLLKEMEKAGL